MQTIFIFTHLIMFGAISSMSYIIFGIEPEEKAAYPFTPGTWLLHLLNRYRAFGSRMKARVLLASGQVSWLKISNRLTRRPGHTI
jgi:hypothetical protein